MAKTIALISFYDQLKKNQFSGTHFSALLKQQALLFDSIGIYHLSSIGGVAKEWRDDSLSELAQNIKIEMDWLESNNLAFELKDDPSFLRELPESSRLEIQELMFQLMANDDVSLPILKDSLSRSNEVEKDVNQRQKMIEALFAADPILLRILALNPVFSRKNIRAVPILSYTNYLPSFSKFTTSNVVQVVINKLPLPDGMTPWEGILDYRNDSEVKNDLIALNRWMRKITSENLSGNEIEEELEWLINEFQSHMKLHKIKATTETIETVIKAPLEIIENLIKLKWSKIPDPFFAIKKRQISLMEAELNAPGREIAYIIKARESFPNAEE